MHSSSPPFVLHSLPISSLLFTSNHYYKITDSVKAGYGTQKISYLKGSWHTFLRVRWPGCEAYHWLPSSAKAKNTWIYISTPPYLLL
jgi:hypothetical protein